MSKNYDQHPIWCQKLGETTEVILAEQDTSWKLWATVTTPVNPRDRGNDYKFIVKHHSGPRKRATFKFSLIRGVQGVTCHYSNFSPAEQYIIPQYQGVTEPFVINVGIKTDEPYRWKPVEERTDKDYLITVGESWFAIDQSVSKELKRYASGKNLDEIELFGVDYQDVITLIDNSELIKDDITVERCRRLGEIEMKYGIMCLSEKVKKKLEMDFWSNIDRLESKIMYNQVKPTVVSTDMKISKTYRAPSLPNIYTINAFNMSFDVYMYIQEYNNTSYLSIGVISDNTDRHDQWSSDKPTDNEYWSKVLNCDIMLHHPQSPELQRSADITREFNQCQRSAGCPTFMLSNELGDYMHNDGSFVVTITLSPTVINRLFLDTSDIQYPGINDIVLCSGGRKIKVSRDLLLHYCDYFKTLPNTDTLSAVIFPIAPLRILLDLIYHRSTALNFPNIRKLLNLSETIMCQYTHNYCDRFLANLYRVKLLSINRTKVFLDSWHLPELREAEQMSDPVAPAPPAPPTPLVQQLPRGIPLDLFGVFGLDAHAINYTPPPNPTSKVYTSKFPSGARIVEPLTVNRLVDIILPLELFKDESERAQLCEQFNAPNGLLKLRAYQEMLFPKSRIGSEVDSLFSQYFNFNVVTLTKKEAAMKFVDKLRMEEGIKIDYVGTVFNEMWDWFNYLDRSENPLFIL